MDNNRRTSNQGGIEELRRRQEARESGSGSGRRPVVSNVRRKEKQGAIGFLVLVGVVLIGVMAVLIDSSKVQDLLRGGPKEYTRFDLAEMAEAYTQNPLRAEQLYGDQYGEIQGFLEGIGKNGNVTVFILTSREPLSVSSEVDQYEDPRFVHSEDTDDVKSQISAVGVLRCTIKDDQYLDVLMSLSKGDFVTACGKITYTDGLYMMEVDSVSRALLTSPNSGDE